MSKGTGMSNKMIELSILKNLINYDYNPKRYPVKNVSPVVNKDNNYEAKINDVSENDSENKKNDSDNYEVKMEDFFEDQYELVHEGEIKNEDRIEELTPEEEGYYGYSSDEEETNDEYKMKENNLKIIVDGIEYENYGSDELALLKIILSKDNSSQYKNYMKYKKKEMLMELLETTIENFR